MWRKLFLLALLSSLLSIAFVQPAAAQTVVWSGSYYDNGSLREPAAFTRQDSAIAFNWGTGSPGPGVEADGWSARWGTDVYLPAGTYRFFALADDEVTIAVDFQVILDTFNQQKSGQLQQVDINLSAGTHHIQVDYRELAGLAYINVTFANVASNPNPPVIVPTQPNPVPVPGGQWTAQYFSNTNLTGSPTLIQSESDINHNWGSGSPAASIPGDNWSARWTTLQTLAAGNYQLRVSADDGVRVFVDGLALINEWHNASGQTYQANINLTAGQHSFLVEFFEAGGLAFLQYQLLQTAPIFPTQPPIFFPTVNPPPGSPTGLTATVTTGRLNVRNQPNPFTGQILATISRNQTFPVLGSNTGNTWLQLNINGVIGWVNASYVRLNTVAGPTPIPPITGNPQAPQTGVNVTAQPYAVNIRSGPGLQFQRLATLPLNQMASVIGRSADRLWWQIFYNGVIGWVSAPFVRVNPGANTNTLPITG